MTGSTPIDPISHLAPTASQKDVVRLLLIPLLVYCAWLVEIYLLEGAGTLLAEPDILPLLLYTVIGCILTGMVVVVWMVTRSFRTRDVTLLQIGFRSVRRTAVTCTLALAAGYLAVVVYTMNSSTPASLPALFCLYLPTGIATVMVCWVLVGTHLQALVRAGGAALSIPTGVIITAILFGLTTKVHTPALGLADPLVPAILLGLVTALFFFSVRDVYATSIVLTTGMALVFSGRVDPAALDRAFVGVVTTAAVSLLALLALHGWLLRSYTTVMVVPDPEDRPVP
jgi:hypothetical protein